jgi:riboflavin biosynthesis pyrimidine reductase
MLMMHAAIGRAWPPSDAMALDHDQLAGCYAVDDRSTRLVRANFVASIDGAATAQGLSGGLSGDADKRVFDILRSLCDVVLVGAGTVRAEGYGPMRLDEPAVQFRRANGLSDQPVFAIVSGTLNLDPQSTAFTKAPVRAIVVTVEASSQTKKEALRRVADVIACGQDKLDVGVMLDAFAQRGLRHVLCEGGPTLFGALLAADRVDELCLTISPLVEAGDARRIVLGAAGKARHMTLHHVLVSDGTLILRYLRSGRTDHH